MLHLLFLFLIAKSNKVTEFRTLDISRPKCVFYLFNPRAECSSESSTNHNQLPTTAQMSIWHVIHLDSLKSNLTPYRAIAKTTLTT